MTNTTPITVYTADCIGNAANCLYPNEVKITDEVSAKLAFARHGLRPVQKQLSEHRKL